MDPFPTLAEISAAQAICKEAWQLSLLASGEEKMRLIAQASPYALDRSEAEGSLYFHWHPRLKAFMVCDFGGFITMIPEEDLYVLVEAVKMEFQQMGAFRERVTGKKASPVKRREPKKFVRTQKVYISLKDLGL